MEPSQRIKELGKCVPSNIIDELEEDVVNMEGGYDDTDSIDWWFLGRRSRREVDPGDGD